MLFRQGDVHEHTELCWLLCSVTAHGDLNRMHQFKDKSAQQRELVSAGLFLYPVLQAADVLAYRAEEVPVGDDQRQHVELMRDIAERFNARFGDVLVPPKHVIPAVGARIMDLQEPGRKMSTTGSEERGLIFIDDDEKAIVKKVKSAVTDSGSEVRRGEGKEGDHQPDRRPRGGPRRGPGGDRGRVRGPAVRRVQGRGGRGGGGLPAPGAGALRGAAARRGGAGGSARRGRGARADDGRPRRWPTCGARWASGRRSSLLPMSVAALDLDLEVFQGPFDLLLTLVLREEVDLLEVQLADVVIAYIDHLDQRGELDLEAATEFLVLIAALLELKSRLMLPGEDEDGLDLGPGEAAEELLARMLEYRRFRAASEYLKERLSSRGGAPLPLRAAAAGAAARVGGARGARLRARPARRGGRRPAALPAQARPRARRRART